MHHLKKVYDLQFPKHSYRHLHYEHEHQHHFLKEILPFLYFRHLLVANQNKSYKS